MIVTVTINVEALRRDLLADSESAFYGGGIGSALFECAEIERASAQELADIAQRKGIDVRRYIVEEEEEETKSDWDPYSW